LSPDYARLDSLVSVYQTIHLFKYSSDIVDQRGSAPVDIFPGKRAIPIGRTRNNSMWLAAGSRGSGLGTVTVHFLYPRVVDIVPVERRYVVVIGKSKIKKGLDKALVLSSAFRLSPSASSLDQLGMEYYR
jgi:hypothetical protein